MKKDFTKSTVIAPLPVLIIATYNENGTPDAMNVAWGGQCGPNHIAISISLSRQTTKNLKSKKAFTVSFATKDLETVSDYFGLVSGKTENKIQKAGLHVVQSSHVDAPIIEEFPLTLECKVVDRREELGRLRVVGEVVNTLVEDYVLDDKDHLDFDKLKLISFDSASHSYRILGEKVGIAFQDGLSLK